MLNTVIWGNSIAQWCLAGAIGVALFFAATLLNAVVGRRLEAWAGHTRGAWDDGLLVLVSHTKRWFFLIGAFFLGTRVLKLPPEADTATSKVAFLALAVQIAIWGGGLIAWWMDRLVRAKADDGGHAMTMKAVGFIARLVFFSVVLLWALDNLGVNVTTLIAGLGVGGIAVALATQNILSDLFASLSIVLDKPFVLGDFIVVGDMMGTIENIGLKTTRVRSLSGEQLVFSNADLLQSRIRNFKRMEERRIQFGFGVTYETSADAVEKIPALVKEIVCSHEGVRFDRAHFKGFGESSLDFEVVYIVLSADFNRYMDIQQSINLKLMRALASRDIGFAFPSRTIYLEKTPALERLMKGSQPDARAEAARQGWAS